MEIYLDNAATTQVFPEVTDLMKKVMEADYGNPSSMHMKGVEAEKYLRRAKQTVSGILKSEEKEIYFTSGGTESNNWALIGAALALKRKGMHIITSPVEHPSVTAPLKILEEIGFTVERLHVDSGGLIDPDELASVIRDDTVLVSIMMVNNETGATEPVAEAGKVIRKKNRDTVFHVDAVQAFGKIAIIPSQLKADLVSASAHKIHGPKGAGFLYVRDGVRIRPYIHGGGQQNGMRSGTDNVPGIAGLMKAAEIACGHIDDNFERISALRKRLKDGLTSMRDVIPNGAPDECSAPHIVNVSFSGIKSEVMLHSLEDKGIYVSAGSACSSHKRKSSPVLTAMGYGKERAASAIRFSLSSYNTCEEIDRVLNVTDELLPVLRKYVRR